MPLRGTRLPTSPLRRLALLGAALVLVTLSCSRDVTGPDGGGSLRFANGLSFRTAFPEAPAGASLPDLVPFTQVRVVLHHSDGTLALDTVVAFPLGADSIVVSLSVALLPEAPSTGEPLALTLDYLNADGDVVFHGGPVTVLAAPGVQSTPPVVVPVSYVGPGATARSVQIIPDTVVVVAGGTFAFVANALDSTGSAMPGTPVAWSLLDSGATLAAASAGRGTAGSTRTTVRVAATLLTGPADTATLFVQPAPSAIALVSGDSQLGTVSTQLGIPVIVKVTATDSGGVGGVPVTFVAGNGGSVDTATATTTPDGLASVHWRLGSGTGDQTLTASVTGLVGSPVTFHATAVAGPATSLAFSTQPPDTVTSALPFTTAATAHDSAGNVATSFTGPVTVALGTNPAADSLKGTLTVNAAAGVATFSTLTLSKADTGLRLTATSTGLAGAMSAPFRVMSGALAGCSLVSGGGQSAALLSALAPVVVLAVDSAGNPVANATLAASVNAGGTLGSGSPVTDATGQATIAWTLGAVLGTQTLSVTCASRVLTVTATATGASVIRTWTGAVSTVWASDSNWSPLGVPGPTDSVYVPSAPANQPVLSAATTVKSLALQTGATLDVGADTLTVTGTLDADSLDASGAGAVRLTGGGAVGGRLGVNLSITGTYTVARTTRVTGAVTVGGSGLLTLNGHPLGVMGTFSTVSSGKLVMANAGDTLGVAGDAVFAGGDETGQLTAGILIVRGGFTQSTTPTSFVASPTFVTRFTAPTLTLSFGMPASSHFGRLELADTTQVNIASNLTATGDVWLPSGLAATVQSGVADSVFVGGSLYDSTGGRWQAATTVLTGVNGRVPKTLTGNLVVAAANALTDSLKVTGALTVTGAGTVLDLNGQRVWVTGGFATTAGAALKMISAMDSLWVNGNASFQGGSTAGLLTNGYLWLAGASFTQGTNPQAFAATAPHVTYLADISGSTSHALTFANPGFGASHFGDLYVGDTLTVLGSDIHADGELETGGFTSHHLRATADQWLASRGANVDGLVFDNVRWQLVDGDTVAQLSTVTFTNISNTTAPQFEWNRSGAGRNVPLTNWVFSTQPTGAGMYVKMTSSAPADTLDLGGNGVTPILSGGFTQALGVGVVVWPNALTYTGPMHGNWNTLGNWNNASALVPDSTTDVIVLPGDSVVLSANSFARALTIGAGAQVDQGNFDLAVYGDLASDPLAGGTSCVGTDSTGYTIQAGGPGTATVQGNFCRYRSARPITQVGRVTVSKLFNAREGAYALNGHTLETLDAIIGGTVGATGALNMTQANDSLIVNEGLQVGGDFGASSSAGVSTLTAGVVTLNGNVLVYGAPGAGYFNSQATQQVLLTGAESQISVSDTSSGFGTVTAQNAPFFLNSSLRVSGNLHLTNFGGFTGSAGRLMVAGNLSGSAGTSITVNAFELGGTNADTGQFSPDTAIYTGVNQLILDSLAAGVGNFNYKSIRVAGTATMQPYGALSGVIFMSGNLIVSGSGNLRVGNGVPFRVNVSDSLVTRDAGTLQLVGDPDSSVVVVLGNAFFAGGDETGKLTGGTLDLRGNFTQAGAAKAFVADTGSVARFAGTASNVSFAWPATSHFGRFELFGAPNVTLSSNVTVKGDVVAPTATYGGVTSATTADSVFLGGSVYDSSSVGIWQVATTVLQGVDARLPVNFNGNLVVAASNALVDSLKVTSGALTVTGAGTVLALNGQRVWVSDSLVTAAGGVLKMVNATDSLWVDGSASFHGGSTTGLLTNGYLWIAGASFSQGTNAAAFAASSPHVTYFADAGAAAPGVVSHTLNFVDPGFSTSHFGNLYLGDTLTILGSDAFADGELKTGSVTTHRVRSSTDRVLVSRGAGVNGLRFDNVRWQVLDGAAVSQLATVTFDSISNNAAPQFEWNRAGTGTTYDPNNWTFKTRPTGAGVYVKMTSSAPVDTLDFVNNAVTPAASGGYTQEVSGGIVWPAPLTYTGPMYGDWNAYGNWNYSGTTIPDSTMDIIIPAGDSISMSAPGAARSLTIGATAQVNQGTNELVVYGDLTTDPSGRIACVGTEADGFTTQVGGPGTAKLQGNFCRYRSRRPIIQVGRVTASSIFQVQDSTYNFNSNTVQTVEAWVGGAPGATGRLTMTQATDSLIVSDSLLVGGSSVSPSAGVSALSAGYIGVGGNVKATTPLGSGAFNSQPPQLVVLSGSERFITITDSTASGFGDLKVKQQREALTPVRVARDLYLDGAASLDGFGQRITVGRDLYGGVNSNLTAGAFELAGVNSDSGYFSPDTAVYTGPNQIILDAFPGVSPSYYYNSVRVTGSATIKRLGASDTLSLNGALTVSDGGSLTIDAATPMTVIVNDSLTTRSGGTLVMSGDPATTELAVFGHTLLDGGDETGKLTGGLLWLGGNFTQGNSSSSTSFAPSGAHVTELASSDSQQVTFASPGTGAAGSHFATLALRNDEAQAGISLGSDLFVDDTLALALTFRDSATISGNGHTVTAAGVYANGGDTLHLVFNNAPFRFVDGNAAATLEGIRFRNFGTAVAFDDARSDSISMDFPRWEGATTTGSFLHKSGSGSAITLNSPFPTFLNWVEGALYLITGSGVLIIPPA